MIRRISVLTLLGLVVGTAVGVLAVGFIQAVLSLNELLGAPAGTRWRTAIMLTVPTVAGLVVGLLALALPEHRYASPADAIRAAQSGDADMPVRSGILTAVSACLSLGAGASVGQYGPLVHLGASVGSWVRRLARADRSIGAIGIACGAAAAISAAFHAPIAGLIFAREVVLRHYSLRAFAPVAVASTLAYVVTHVVFGRQPLFRIDDHIVANAYEYLVFVAIGVVGALLATLYMRAIQFASRIAGRMTLPVPLRTALAGLCLGIVALEFPEILGIGHETLRDAMAGDVLGAARTAQILVLKLLATALCLGFGFAGGVFSPALLIGALFGSLVGAGADWLVGAHHSPIAVYAVCGIGAVTSPVIGAPLTIVLVVFELTQNFDLAAAAMVSVAFANLVGFRVFGRSLFDVQLRERGFDLDLGRDKVIAQQHAITDLDATRFSSGTSSQSLFDIRKLLIHDGRSEAHIVDADGRYAGTLTLHRLMELAESGVAPGTTAGEFAQPASVTLAPDTSVWDAMTLIEGFVGESIPILDGDKLVGALPEAAIVGAYLEILDRIRREEHAAA